MAAVVAAAVAGGPPADGAYTWQGPCLEEAALQRQLQPKQQPQRRHQQLQRAQRLLLVEPLSPLRQRLLLPPLLLLLLFPLQLLR